MGALRLAFLWLLLVVPAEARATGLDSWSSEIDAASARFGVPADWVRRVMRIESGGQAVREGRPVVSPAGAMGLMQLMPGTWREMRAILGLGSDPFDPHDNIAAGTFYLRLMYDRFGYPGLFAAYNAGPARYAASFSGRPLPRETRDYVARAIGARLSSPAAAGANARAALSLRSETSLAPRSARQLAPRSQSLFIELSAAR